MSAPSLDAVIGRSIKVEQVRTLESEHFPLTSMANHQENCLRGSAPVRRCRRESHLSARARAGAGGSVRSHRIADARRGRFLEDAHTMINARTQARL